MLQEPSRRQPRGNIAAKHAIDGSISRRKQQGSVKTNHGRASGKEKVDWVQHNIRDERDCDNHNHTHKHGSDASANMLLRLRFPHDACAPALQVPVDGIVLSQLR
jgi:hypothetical protein